MCAHPALVVQDVLVLTILLEVLEELVPPLLLAHRARALAAQLGQFKGGNNSRLCDPLTYLLAPQTPTT